MSVLPEQPAFPGLFPEEKWRQAPDFSTFLPIKWAYAEYLEGHSPPRIFRLSKFQGDPPEKVLIRIAASRWKRAQEGFRLAHSLAESGAPVVAPELYDQCDGQGEALFSWHDPLHICSSTDLRALIHAIERLYEALAAQPKAFETAFRAQSHRQRLKQILPEAKRHWSHLDWSHLSLLEHAPRCLHGDMNLGNLRASSQGPVFIDFEDAAFAWWNPVVDLGLLYERLYWWGRRFCPALPGLLARLFLPWALEMCDLSREDFWAGMQANSLRALLLLYPQRQSPWAKAEIEKFLWLYAQHKKSGCESR